MPGGGRAPALCALRRVQQPRARRVAAHHAASLLRAQPRRPRGGGGRRARALSRRAAARGRRLARRTHPGPLPGGARGARARAGRARRLLAAGRGQGRRVHGECAPERGALVPHGAQPAPHGARARVAAGRGGGGGGGGVRLGRGGARADRATVRRGVHGATLRVRVGGGVLPRGVAATQAGRGADAAAVPVRGGRPVPAAAGDAGAGGGGGAARGAGGDGSRRAHRVPGGLVAGERSAGAVPDAADAAVLRRDAAAPGPAAGGAPGGGGAGLTPARSSTGVVREMDRADSLFHIMTQVFCCISNIYRLSFIHTKV